LGLIATGRTAPLRFFGDLDWANWIIPSACVLGGGMVRMLLTRSLGPLALVVAVPFAGSVYASVRYLLQPCEATRADQADQRGTRKQSMLLGSQGREAESLRHAIATGLLEWLPASLVFSYCFTPSVSAQIFKAWHCVPFAYDEAQQHSYLVYDLTIRCDGFAEHNNILFVAWQLVVIWPIGMVALFAVLLIPCRKLLLRDEALSSPLLRATQFLHRDYQPAYYCAHPLFSLWLFAHPLFSLLLRIVEATAWLVCSTTVLTGWEVVALLQRTILTGWLLLVNSELKILRLLIALVIAICFLMLILVCNPYKR
jgi:hypothetical protein